MINVITMIIMTPIMIVIVPAVTVLIMIMFMLILLGTIRHDTHHHDHLHS